jgi:hypothetical protein
MEQEMIQKQAKMAAYLNNIKKKCPSFLPSEE